MSFDEPKRRRTCEGDFEADLTDFNVTDLPDRTCDWRGICPEEIHRLFKTRIAVCDADYILCPASENGTNLNTWPYFKGPTVGRFDNKYEVYLNYLDEALKKLDIDYATWYEAFDSQEQLMDDTTSTFSVLTQDLIRLRHTRYPHNLFNEQITEEIVKMNENIDEWLFVLRTVLSTDWSDIGEASFEEIFRGFTRIVGLSCFRGDYLSEMKFQYQDERGEIVKSVSGSPDVLLCDRRKGFAVAVAEVEKKYTVGEIGAQAYPTIPKQNNESLTSDYPNGNVTPLPSDEEIVSSFLPKLLGETIAATCEDKMKLAFLKTFELPHGHITQKSAIGFCLVGFVVYVVNFMCVRRDEVMDMGPWSMHRIPYIKGMGLDILISEPLHILKRSDRNKLFRLLFAMRTTDYELTW